MFYIYLPGPHALGHLWCKSHNQSYYTDIWILKLYRAVAYSIIDDFPWKIVFTNVNQYGTPWDIDKKNKGPQELSGELVSF